MVKKILCAILVAVLGGCAAYGPAFQPANEPPQNAALIYVYRPDALAYGARDAHIFLNDKHALKVSSNGYSYFYITPGTYKLRQKWPGLSGYDDRELSIPITAQSGKTYFFRFSTWVSSSDKPSPPGYISYILNWKLEEILASQALREISLTKLQPALIKEAIHKQ